MAATPKRKTSKSARNQRRSHLRLKLPQLKVSKDTGELVPVGTVSKAHPKHKGVTIVKAKKAK